MTNGNNETVILVRGNTMKKGLVTIDREKILLSRNKAGEIVFTPEAEEELKKVIEFKKLAEDILDYVQDKLMQAMEAEKLQKIVSGDLSVSRRFYGGKFEVSDAEEAKEILNKIVSYKLDTEKVEGHWEKTGEMPKGISLKKRTQSVSITKRGDSE